MNRYGPEPWPYALAMPAPGGAHIFHFPIHDFDLDRRAVALSPGELAQAPRFVHGRDFENDTAPSLNFNLSHSGAQRRAGGGQRDRHHPLPGGAIPPTGL